MNVKSLGVLVCTFVLCNPACFGEANSGGSAVEVLASGAQAQKGQILVSLFNSKASFLKEPVATASLAVDAQGAARLDLGRHPPGEYAAAVIYDKNENGELDTGLFGIPKEKVGFSNDAKGRFGPAKWEDARFELDAQDALLEVHLISAKDGA